MFCLFFLVIVFLGMFGGFVVIGIIKIGYLVGFNFWSWFYIVEGCIFFLVVFWVWFGLLENLVKVKYWIFEEWEMMEC